MDLDVDDCRWLESCRLCAGDGCIFILEKPTDERAGSVFKFCPAARSLELIAPWNPFREGDWDSERWDPSWAYHRGHLYGACGNRVQSLDVSTGHWEALPPLLSPSSRAGATPCGVGGRLFLVGGGNTASVDEYVAPERRWVSLPDLPRRVQHAAAVAFEGKLLVIGGVFGLNCFSAVLEYDPGDGSWKELPSLRTARYDCAATVLDGELVVLGGKRHAGPPIGCSAVIIQLVGDAGGVERYNRRRQCWEAIASLPAPLDVGRHRFAAVAVRALDRHGL